MNLKSLHCMIMGMKFIPVLYSFILSKLCRFPDLSSIENFMKHFYFHFYIFREIKLPHILTCLNLLQTREIILIDNFHQTRLLFLISITH